VGVAAGSWGRGAGEAGVKPLAGTEPWGPASPTPGCSPAMALWGTSAHWCMTVSGLGREQKLPRRSQPKGYCNPVTSETLLVLSAVAYLLPDRLLKICNGNKVLGFPALVA